MGSFRLAGKEGGKGRFGRVWCVLRLNQAGPWFFKRRSTRWSPYEFYYAPPDTVAPDLMAVALEFAAKCSTEKKIGSTDSHWVLSYRGKDPRKPKRFGRTLPSSAAGHGRNARPLLLCAGYLDESRSQGRGAHRGRPRGIFLRATRSRTGIFSARLMAADQAGDGGGYLCLGGQLRFSRHAGDPAVPAAEFFSSLAARSCMWSSSPSTRSASRSRRSRPSAIPSPRCGSTASSPPAFPSAAARPRDYIAAGKCELNYAPCMKGDKQAAEGDVITIRGLGKIRLETIGGSTKKGRIAIKNYKISIRSVTMKKGDIERINELFARKARPSASRRRKNEERAKLRRAYIDSVVGDLRQQHWTTPIVDAKGQQAQSSVSDRTGMIPRPARNRHRHGEQGAFWSCDADQHPSQHARAPEAGGKRRLAAPPAPGGGDGRPNFYQAA